MSIRRLAPHRPEIISRFGQTSLIGGRSAQFIDGSSYERQAHQSVTEPKTSDENIENLGTILGNVLKSTIRNCSKCVTPEFSGL